MSLSSTKSYIFRLFSRIQKNNVATVNITFLIRTITLIYFLAFLLSIVCLYLGTISQLHKYELERIKTKSDIKRGMSLFPTFPLTSILYLLFLYFLNSYKDDLGTYLVSGYGICVSIIHLSYFSYYKYQIGKCSS